MLELDGEGSATIHTSLDVERFERVDLLFRPWPEGLLQVWRPLWPQLYKASILVAIATPKYVAFRRVDGGLHGPVICLKKVQFDAHLVVEAGHPILSHIAVVAAAPVGVLHTDQIHAGEASAGNLAEVEIEVERVILEVQSEILVGLPVRCSRVLHQIGA